MASGCSGDPPRHALFRVTRRRSSRLANSANGLADLSATVSQHLKVLKGRRPRDRPSARVPTALLNSTTPPSALSAYFDRFWTAPCPNWKATVRA